MFVPPLPDKEVMYWLKAIEFYGVTHFSPQSL